MNPKLISVRDPAQRDLARILDRYWFDASPQVSRAFALAPREAFRHLSRFPSTGSSRYSRNTPLPNLRSWPIRGFPYLIFYVEEASSVDVYRLLHTARDIPESLTEGLED